MELQEKDEAGREGGIPEQPVGQGVGQGRCSVIASCGLGFLRKCTGKLLLS